MADSTFTFEFPGCGSTWNGARAADGITHADANLIAGLKVGDDRCYEALIARFENPVYNLVYRLMTDPGDACDVVQEVFLKVFRSIGSFRGESSLKTWIYRIAVNEAHNHRRWFFRRRGNEVGLEDDPGDGKTYEQVLHDAGPSPLEIAVNHEAQALVEEALKQVKPAFREAVVLRDIEGMRYEEIAEVLDLSLGTVKSRILRGRESLREHLAGRLKLEPRMELAVQGAKS